MDTTTDGVSDDYRDGAYHERLFASDPFVQDVIAHERAHKLAAHIRRDHSVFELGVGKVLNLRFLPARERVGSDPYRGAAELCASFGVEFVSQPTDLKDRTFDIVLCHHVLEHVVDPMATLVSLRSLVARDGRLLLYVPLEFNRRYRRWWPNEPNRHLFSWNALTLGNLVTAAGFTVERVRIRAYGYEQRLGRIARFNAAVFKAALWAARRVRPSHEIELVARRSE
jgi:SAM-dependent methyltransferase